MVKTAAIVCKRRRNDFTGSFVGHPYPASSKCMGMAADPSTCRGQMRYADSDTDIKFWGVPCAAGTQGIHAASAWIVCDLCGVKRAANW